MRAFVVVGAIGLAACASTELEIPDNHPANAKSPAPPVATSTVLRPDFDPFAGGAEPAAPDPHAHHHHGAAGK